MINNKIYINILIYNIMGIFREEKIICTCPITPIFVENSPIYCREGITSTYDCDLRENGRYDGSIRCRAWDVEKQRCNVCDK